MKFALFINSLQRGGSERVMATLADYLVGQGDEVLLVTQYRYEDEYPVDPRVVRILSEPEPYELRSGALGRIYNLRLRLRKLTEIWEREKPDRILSFIGKNNLMALWSARRLPIPVAVSVRADPAYELESPLEKSLSFRLFRRASRVILQSREAMDFFPEAIRKRSIVLPNPLNPAFLQRSLDAIPRLPRITAVGRLDENKGHALMIRAFARIADRHPEYTLHIYGEGPLRESLTDLAARLGLADRVVLEGRTDKVPQVLSEAEIFLLASGNEGLPNTLLEALSRGTPAICTDATPGAVRGVLAAYGGGLLVPVGDEWQMAEAMDKLLREPALRAKLSAEGISVRTALAPETVLAAWRDELSGMEERRA